MDVALTCRSSSSWGPGVSSGLCLDQLWLPHSHSWKSRQSSTGTPCTGRGWYQSSQALGTPSCLLGRPYTRLRNPELRGYCIYVRRPTVGVAQLEGLVEPRAKALLTGGKHITHLGRWCTLSYQNKSVDYFEALLLPFCPGQWTVTETAWLSLSRPALPACWPSFHRFLGSPREYSYVN